MKRGRRFLLFRDPCSRAECHQLLITYLQRQEQQPLLMFYGIGNGSNYVPRQNYLSVVINSCLLVVKFIFFFLSERQSVRNDAPLNSSTFSPGAESASFCSDCTK